MSYQNSTMESEYKIKGVIFARNWFEAVRPGLLPSDRLQFYDAVFDYAFAGTILPGMVPAVKIAFEMVKPFIDQDIVKYRERCERNRSNARGLKRVAASGSESLPVATNTNINTSTNTNTNTNTISISEERQKFLVCGQLFARGAMQPREEMQRFWAYYESLGWKNNKGAPIVRKQSAAAMWNMQFGVTENALELRKAWYDAFARLESADYVIFDNVKRLTISEGNVVIAAKDFRQFAELMRKQYPQIVQGFMQAVGVQDITFCDIG